MNFAIIISTRFSSLSQSDDAFPYIRSCDICQQDALDIYSMKTSSSTFDLIKIMSHRSRQFFIAIPDMRRLPLQRTKISSHCSTNVTTLWLRQYKSEPPIINDNLRKRCESLSTLRRHSSTTPHPYAIFLYEPFYRLTSYREITLHVYYRCFKT